MVDEFGQDLYVIGKYLGDCDRSDSIIKGTYKFTNDYQLQNKLFGRTLGSPYAHAKVLSIDTSKAEALDGVEAVITCLDEEGGWSTMGWTDHVLCWGQEVAAVAAVDEYTAERALLLIDVEYDVLDFRKILRRIVHGKGETASCDHSREASASDCCHDIG